MARIRPFRSGRPPQALATRVASVPYDVVDTKEARALAAGNPVSFLHVCRPEIDLPETTDIHADEVYAKGRENLDRFYADGTLVDDPVPRLLDLPPDVAGPVAGRLRGDLLGGRLRHGRHPQAREDAQGQGGRPRPPPPDAVRARRARLPDVPRRRRDRRARQGRDGAEARVRLRGARRGPPHAVDRPGGRRRVLRLGIRAGPAPLRRRRPPPLRERVARPRRARGEDGRQAAGRPPGATGSRRRSSRTASSRSSRTTGS